MIRRDAYLKKLLEARKIDLINVVTGMRRSGKTTLIFDIFVKHLIEIEKVPSNHILTYMLDDYSYIEYTNPDVIFKDIKSKIIDNSDYYILIDEVQKINKFEYVLNSFVGKENIHVYVTGSNAKFLSKDLITEFRGRSHEIYIHPLSFKEYYSNKTCSREQALKNYLQFGGLPQLEKIENDVDKINYLKQIFFNTYLTDIIQKSHIQKNENELEETLNVVSSCISSLISPNSLSNTFKSVKNKIICPRTIKKYLTWFEDSFLVEEVKQFNIKGKKYISSPSKYYFTDLGIRNAQLDFRQVEYNHLLENLVFNELKIRGYSIDTGVIEKYEKDSNGRTLRKRLEVDFVCKKGDKIIYVQVADNLNSKEKLEQEIRSLNSINDSNKKIIITKETLVSNFTNEGVKIMNIFNFLLNDDL